MPGNKFRVYVAASSRDGISNCPELESLFGHSMYHWGIWVEPKKGKGKGHLYDVEEHKSVNCETGLIPGGWRFGLLSTNSHTNQRLIGRIMIGKLPSGIDYDDMEQFLSKLALPVEHGEESCTAWVRTAIQELQKIKPQPWAENFDVDEFMTYAYQAFKSWYTKHDWQFSDRKANYTRHRKFP